MNNIQYFKSAWGDIKNSPGWFGKLCLLALLNFIPVFGQIVAIGYMYGWAREIAWGTHEPMPARVLGNEDGKLYRRGWFIFVLTFVVGLVMSVVMGVGQSMQGVGLWGIAHNSHSVGVSLVSGLGSLVYLVGLVGGILLSILAWIGSMRISIYDRLSAGFQVGKIWKMFRHDTGGIMRIFGMDLLFWLVIGILISIVLTVFLFFVIFAGIAGLAASGYNVEVIRHMTDTQMMNMILQFIASAGFIGIIALLAVMFLAYVGALFVQLLVVRAMGYWTMQFDVPNWRGQDDPMPFEAAGSAAGIPPVYPPSQAGDPQVHDPYAPSQQPGQSQQPQQFVQQAQWPAQSQQAQWPEQPAQPGWFGQQPPVSPTGFQEAQVVDGADEVDGVDEADIATGTEALPPDDSEARPMPDEPSPIAEPGQFPGFTYGGSAPAPAPTPVTESGADPSAPTMPDLLVVVPEAPAAGSADGEYAPDADAAPEAYPEADEPDDGRV